MDDVAQDPGRRPLPGDLARLLHDVRGPLNSAVMHLEVVKRLVDAPGADESLRTALEQLARLAEMLPAAFDVASVELAATRRLDVGAVVARAVEGLAAVTTAAEPGVEVVGDDELLLRAIGELLANAVEATPPGAREPEIAVRRAGAQAIVAVRDRGPGLRTTNPRLLIRLLHTTKPGHRGLGLVVAERIARLHGGTLRFEQASPGALVSLVLPLAK